MDNDTNPAGTGLDEKILGIPRDQFNQNAQAYVDIVAKYYGDPDFREKADANPLEVLSAEGLLFPEGCTRVKLVFNSQDRFHLVLPKDAIELDAD